MTAAFITAAVFLSIALIFVVLCLIGERTFWGKQYLKQGYQVLLSRRFDGYIFDTLALCVVSLFTLLYIYDSSIWGEMDALTRWCFILFVAVMLLCARLLRQNGTLYNDEGLLLAKPFRRLRFVPWDEIGRVQKRSVSAQFYDIFDQNGCRLVWCPLNNKTRSFFDLAQKNGVSVHVSKESEMAVDASCRKLNGTLGKWDAVLSKSKYAKNDVIAFAPFDGFMVALFMDRHLNEDNVIAINQDGTIRWTISEIIRQTSPVSYTALTKGSEKTIHVMAVMDRQYDRIVYEINVYEKKVVREYSDAEDG